MNQFMLLFIGGSISPTEFKVSYFPKQITSADYEYHKHNHWSDRDNIVIKLQLLELCPLLYYILSCV